MDKEIAAPRLDVSAFAQSAGSLAGSERLASFPRIMDASDGTAPDTLVQWAVRGETRHGLPGQPQSWLHLDADARVPQECQRCLAPLQVHLRVERWFRFVDDEASALAQDETSEEDLLVLEPDFDLHALIEDELLLELPYVARHEACPTQPRMSATDPAFTAGPERPNPFAALAALKSDKPG